MGPGEPRIVVPAPEVRKCRNVGVFEGQEGSLQTSDPFFTDIPIETHDKRETLFVVSEKSLTIVCL